VLDLADIPLLSARRIPLASWFRFRRAVEHTPTVMLVLEQQPIAGSCSSLLVKVTGGASQVSGLPCEGQRRLSGKKPSAFSHQDQVAGVRYQVSGKTLPIKCEQSASCNTDLVPGLSDQGNAIDQKTFDDQEKAAARPSHTELLDRFEITAELLRSRLERKPAPAVANFRSRAKWAG
jgi:hypothetical protein